MSESVMLALVKKGMDRQEAHNIIRGLAIESKVKGMSFKNILSRSVEVNNLLNKMEINEALDPQNYLGTTFKQIKTVANDTIRERKKRNQKSTYV